MTDSIRYVGVNDHDVDLFEGQYVVPNGMAYNSYVILDEKVAILDTVDHHKCAEYLDNLDAAWPAGSRTTSSSTTSSPTTPPAFRRWWSAGRK